MDNDQWFDAINLILRTNTPLAEWPDEVIIHSVERHLIEGRTVEDLVDRGMKQEIADRYLLIKKYPLVRSESCGSNKAGSLGWCIIGCDGAIVLWAPTALSAWQRLDNHPRFLAARLAK